LKRKCCLTPRHKKSGRLKFTELVPVPLLPPPELLGLLLVTHLSLAQGALGLA
jgi:hypothetical protein